MDLPGQLPACRRWSAPSCRKTLFQATTCQGTGWTLHKAQGLCQQVTASHIPCREQNGSHTPTESGKPHGLKGHVTALNQPHLHETWYCRKTDTFPRTINPESRTARCAVPRVHQEDPYGRTITTTYTPLPRAPDLHTTFTQRNGQSSAFLASLRTHTPAEIKISPSS